MTPAKLAADECGVAIFVAMHHMRRMGQVAQVWPVGQVEHVRIAVRVAARLVGLSARVGDRLRRHAARGRIFGGRRAVLPVGGVAEEAPVVVVLVRPPPGGNTLLANACSRRLVARLAGAGAGRGPFGEALAWRDRGASPARLRAPPP